MPNPPTKPLPEWVRIAVDTVAREFSLDLWRLPEPQWVRLLCVALDAFADGERDKWSEANIEIVVEIAVHDAMVEMRREIRRANRRRESG